MGDKMLRTKVFFTSTIILLGVIGCDAPKQWNKAGVGRHDTDSALADCRYNVGKSNVASERERQLITDCMQGKGYRFY